MKFHTLFVLISLVVPLSRALAVERGPEQVAQALLEVYGQKLESLAYIPALGVYGRFRFAQLTHNEQLQQQVFALLAQPQPAPKAQVEYAGHLLLAEVARSGDGAVPQQARAMVIRAANQWFDARGQARLPGPQEMSDALFMVPPLLCEAGSLTHEDKYFTAAVAYLQAMQQLRQRADGLYRHGHACDAAWGRGNGFPAVGLAWCLTCLPADHASREVVLAQYRRHMEALLPHQTESGAWRQVIDHPASYEEFSCTAMIGFAMQRGVAQGWLPAEKYQPAADRAWRALTERIQPGGKLLDVCEGTGTQPNLEAYLQRRALRGVDARGGAMALLFANERLAAEK